MMNIGNVFNKISCVCMVAVAIIGTMVQAAELTSTAYFGGNNLMQPRIIVKYKESQYPAGLTSSLMAQQAQITSKLKRLSAHTGQRLSRLRELSNGATVIELKGPKTPAQLDAFMAALQADDQVEYAEPDIFFRVFMVPNDPLYNEQWSLFDSLSGINVQEAWPITTGHGVVVAVLDTGILQHQDLVANLLPGYDFITNVDIAADGDGRDPDATDPGDWVSPELCYKGSSSTNSSWHGTHVAGIIAAQANNSVGIAGVASGAKILPIRIIGRCGGWLSDITDAVVWAAGGEVTGVPPNVTPAKVINMSLDGASDTCTPTMQNAIDQARELGATIVTVAGNANQDASHSVPANCDGVITVAATNKEGGRAFYSNYGDVVDIAAPGGGQSAGILSTLNEGKKAATKDTYGYYSGTSMAAPHVAGVAALLYAINPGLSPAEVENIITSSARAFPVTCDQCGSGLLDAKAALRSLLEGDYTGAKATLSDLVLVNGVAKTALHLSVGEALFYSIDIPANAGNLKIVTEGGKGDVDLYVKYQAAPTLDSYDCRPYFAGNKESCSFATPGKGTYHIMLYGYEDSSGVSLKASY